MDGSSAGLSKLGFEYHELPDAVTCAVERAACAAGGPAGLLSVATRDAAVCEEGTALSTFVHSLGSMNALWFSADRDDRDDRDRDINGGREEVDVADRRRRMLSHQLCIEICRAMEAHTPSMNEQGSSNTLFGLAKVCMHW